jgi:N-acetylneuraminic acid mutarotase
MRNNRLALLLLLLIGGCLDDNLDTLEFVVAVTEPPTPIDVGAIQLNGRVDGLNLESVDSCGFVWSEDEKAIRDLNPGLASIPASVRPGGNGPFDAVFRLKQGQIVFFRAWAALGERRVYGEVEPYSLDQIIVMNMNEATVFNDSAHVRGRLVGVELQNTKVRYGHVYAPEHVAQIPALGLPGCLATPEVETLEDKTFESGLKGLSFNTTYRFRAYAIGLQDTFYSQTVDTFRVRDGWRQVDAFPLDYKDGTGIGSGSTGFAGFGCGNTGTCPQNDLLPAFRAFDLTALPGNQWQNATPFPDGIGEGQKRTNALSLALGDTVYVIFGEFINPDFGSNTLSVIDFYKYVPSVNIWIKGPKIPDLEAFRTGAVGFVSKGKLYVGAGVKYPNNIEEYHNNFWEYTPATSSWRTVAGLPARISFFDTQPYFIGRYEAAAFSINDTGYVGGGEIKGGIQLTDFWKFTAPTGISPQDTGKWELVGFFPGLGRVDAVAFAIGNKGYYGTGYNTQSGYLDDFWEFDPTEPEPWKKRTPFLGGRRGHAFGFSIGNTGYLGTGLSQKVINNGQNLESTLHRDVWMYTPEQ